MGARERVPRPVRGIGGPQPNLAPRADATVAITVALAQPLALDRGAVFIMQVPRQPVAEKSLGAALRHRVRRNRIHLGRVDEVDALRDRVVELRMCFGLAVLLAPGHGAEADLGYLELRAGQCAVFHSATRKLSGERARSVNLD